jgi:glycosyltransferase involved in cell wall biosynthesis
MDQRLPLLTVAMPVFNGGAQLRLALLSILRQSFTDWELILIDDGSTDRSVEGVADIVDSRVRIVCDGYNKGLAARLNEAIDMAHGEYFARMDQDDISHPERFSKQLALLQVNQSLDLVGTRCVTISENDQLLGSLPGSEKHEELCQRPWLGFHLPHPTWMGRTAWFRKHRYAVPGPYCCEDQEMLLRTHSISHFYVLPEYLLAYRLRDRFNLAKAWRTRKTLYQIQQAYFINRKDYWHAALALIGFCLRVAKDIKSRLAQFLFFKEGKSSQTCPISDSNTEAWCQIIKDLHAPQMGGGSSIGAK